MASGPDVSVFEHGGFVFESRSGPISATARLDAISDALRARCPLPEQTFGDNALVIRHVASGETLEFSACGALTAWHRAQVTRLGDGVDATRFDWTFATAYDGDFMGGESAGHTPDASGGTPALPVDARAGAALPRGRLLRRTPILHYVTVPLYADELHDRGHCEVGVKLRVMHDCFLALLRCFVRLDGERVWLRDTRWYGELDDGGSGAAGVQHGAVDRGWRGLRVWMDVQVRRAGVDEVRRALADAAAPCDGLPSVARGGAHTTTQMPLVGADVGGDAVAGRDRVRVRLDVTGDDVYSAVLAAEHDTWATPAAAATGDAGDA